MTRTIEQEEEVKVRSKVSNLCEECELKEWKYKCPGCSVRSCSLPCVKAHKLRTLCTGKRNRTEFLPISQFTDSRLLADYNLLEEIRNAGESAKRLRNKLSIYPHFFKVPIHLQKLRNVIMGRRTNLQFLPCGMSRREQNQTRYDQRKKRVLWTIEWRFHSTNVALIDHVIDENTNIHSIIGKHLQPGPWNHQLKKFCDEGLDSLKFFLRKFPKLAKSPLHELDVNAPLRQQLENKYILEYPVINVFLSSHTFDVEVIKQAHHPDLHKPRHEISKSSDRLMSPRGIPFKEEEIEEEEEDERSSDPRVLDMTMKHGNLVASPNNHLNRSNRSENVLASSTEAIEQAMFNDVDFDFDQGIIDAYSNLIAEANPDDFLDLEGLLPQQEVTEEEWKGGLFAKRVEEEEEDLEEGEIIE